MKKTASSSEDHFGEENNAHGLRWKKIYSISHKLKSFGVLLERQGEEREGFVELEGLGLALQEMGDELYEIWSVLD